MSREGPGPPVFGSDYSKSRVGPLHFFNFGSMGPSSFKSKTTPLLLLLDKIVFMMPIGKNHSFS